MAVADPGKLADVIEELKAPEISNLISPEKYGILDCGSMIGSGDVKIVSDKIPVSNGTSTAVSDEVTDTKTEDVNLESRETAKSNAELDETATSQQTLFSNVGECAEKQDPKAIVLKAVSQDQIAESDIEITESDDKITESDDKRTAVTDKLTVSADKITDSDVKDAESDEKIAKSGDKITESDDKITESDDKITESDDKITESDEKISESDDRITESVDKLTGSDEKDAESDDKTTESDDKITESDEKITESDEKITESDNKITESDDKITESDEKISESDVKITESNDKITESDDKLIESAGKLTESADKITDSDVKDAESDDKITESDDIIIESDDKITESDDKITESDDKVTKSDVKVTESDVKIIESDDKITESDDKITESDDKITESDDKITESDDKITESDDEIKESDDKITESDDKITESDVKITESDVKITESDDKITESDDKITESDDKITESDDKITESDVKITESDDKIKEPRIAAPGPCDEVVLSREKGSEFPDVEEVTNLASEIISDCKNVDASPSVDQNDNLLNKTEVLCSNNSETAVPAGQVQETSVVSNHSSSADLEGESESESEGSEEVECCHNAHKFVNDLSSEEKSSAEETPDITVLRKERRQRKRKKRQKRLKKCCSGCDTQGNVEPLSPDLPSPIALSTGMMQCNVIKSFEEVVSTRYDSEEEIDAAISSYSAVGGRLANQNEQTFSDVDVSGNKSRSECGSPASDPDVLVCDYSNSVGRKLANRNLNQPNDNLDACIGGYLLDSLNQNLDPTSRLFAMGVDELRTMLKGLQHKLQNVNEELVAVVKENDDLKAEKSVITKHVVQLSRLAQGIRANDNSAFRKILVTRETDI